jgi:plastocyanin
VAAALGVVSDGSAAPRVFTVAITATGPSPSTLRIRVGDVWGFVNEDSVAHTLLFYRHARESGYCNLSPAGEPAPGAAPCEGPVITALKVGRYSYSVDGRFAGKVIVSALARSVSLTARAHSVRLGGRLTLHGQETFDNRTVSGVCVKGASEVLRVFARHATSQPFKRIAVLRAGHPRTSGHGVHGCSYRWQLEVRPGITTTYIVETDSGPWYKQAISKPFTVLIRP